MKYYTITVNGNTYNVSVEEGIAAPATTPVAAAPVAPVPQAVAAPASPAPAPEIPAATPTTGGSTGSVKVAAPMPGKIISTKAGIGQSVKKGDVILILEAMKMENEIVAPQDGTVASIDVSAGDAVEAGTILATLN
ncbi:MAG: hypothetical protein K0R00_4078 [Herbinix sp.]|jgi:biotin carboxyl carrier protein|nr:hypothetical protein [Herbinix sp.]